MSKNYILNGLEEQEERIAWMRLIRSENIGPTVFCQLLARYGSAKKALEHLIAGKNGVIEGRRIAKIPSRRDIEIEIENVESIGGKIITKLDTDYPELLHHIIDPPPVLTILGDATLLKSNRILAIVGARNASAAGKKLAYDFSMDLGQAGWVIVSGMACGIDAQAHKAALKTGTIAVLAGGIDNIYPDENKQLYADIREMGLLISEAPWGQAPCAHLFPKRNRIIAGLGKGTLIIEAGLQSGSIRTAQYAADYDRTVFVVPGHPYDPRSKGSNALIQKGHCLVQSSKDLENLLQQDQMLTFAEPDYDFDQTASPIINQKVAHTIRAAILDQLSFTPVTWDTLSAAVDVPLAQLRAYVVELELNGNVQIVPGGRIVLTPKKE